MEEFDEARYNREHRFTINAENALKEGNATEALAWALLEVCKKLDSIDTQIGMMSL